MRYIRNVIVVLLAIGLLFYALVGITMAVLDLPTCTEAERAYLDYERDYELHHRVQGYFDMNHFDTRSELWGAVVAEWRAEAEAK